MVIPLFITAGILLELIVLVGGIYIIVRYFKKISTSPDKVEIKVTERAITSEVIRDGVKSAIREITYEDEQERLFEKKRRVAEKIYNSAEAEELPIESGGELIPFDISDSEREILRQFYSKDD